MRIISRKFRAFGIIETLIACAILMIICGALLTVNLIITRDIAFARDRAVAYNLAQEAIESGRQIRDTNLVDRLSTTNWNTLVCDPLSSPALSSPIISVDNNQHYYTLSSGKYSSCYGSSDSNPKIALASDLAAAGENIKVEGITYNRKIHFFASGLRSAGTNLTDDIIKDNAVKMVVDISWTDRGSSRTVSVTELLTNWKRGL